VLIDRIADGMMFGALPEGCGQDDCSGGHLYLDKTTGKYRCTGNSSVWSKCMWEGELSDVKAKAWKIPEWLADEYDYFRHWRYQKRDRAVVKNEVLRAEGKEKEEVGIKSEEAIKSERAKRKFFQIGKKSKAPLDGCTIALDVKKTRVDKLKEIIEELGGTYSDKVNPKVTHLISTDNNYDDETPKVSKAVTLDIPILTEDWLKDSKSKKEFLNQNEYLIGGSEHAINILEREFTDPAEDEKKEAEKKRKRRKSNW